MDLLTLVDKLTPVLVVIIPSYFSFKSTKTTKEADKRIEGLSNKIDTLEKSVSNVEDIGKDNQRNLTIIGFQSTPPRRERQRKVAPFMAKID